MCKFGSSHTHTLDLLRSTVCTQEKKKVTRDAKSKARFHSVKKTVFSLVIQTVALYPTRYHTWNSSLLVVYHISWVHVSHVEVQMSPSCSTSADLCFLSRVKRSVDSWVHFPCFRAQLVPVASMLCALCQRPVIWFWSAQRRPCSAPSTVP